METLYAKLYDKYTTLKKKRFSELDEVNREQEEKFQTFVSASDALTKHLKSEIQNLKEVVGRLRNENTEVRNLKEVVERLRNENTEIRNESRKSLVEEELKNKALSEQVEKLKELISKGVPHNDNNDKDQSGRTRKTPESPQVTTRSMRKRSRQSEDNMVETDTVSPTRSMRKRSRQTETEDVVETDEVSPTRSLRKRGRLTVTDDVVQTDMVSPHKSTTETVVVVSQPQCCKTTDEGSSNSPGCPFQVLGEHLIGMKLDTNNEGGLVASHPSSGLSFSLTLINNSNDEEAELLYNVISLGTFQRVVPTWMRDVIKFNPSMIPVFFERVSRVIKPRG